MSSKKIRHRTIYWLFLGLCLAVFSSVLILLILLAFKMRLSGDDYCYNAILSQYGFWRMPIHSYLKVTMYHGNRYSLTIFSAFAGMFPILGSGLMSMLSLIAWLIGLTWVISWFAKRLKLDATILEAFLMAEVYVCFVLWSAPTLEQSFFWRSGMLPYFMPIVGGTWLLFFVILSAEAAKGKWAKLLLLLIISVIVGGFSETGAALQMGVWGLILLAVVLERLFGKKHLEKFALPATLVMIGTIISFALMLFSPTTEIRQATTPGLLRFTSLISLLGWNVKVYFWIALMRRTFSVILPILFGFGLGLYYINPCEEQSQRPFANLKWQKIISLLFFLGICLLFLIACIMLPATAILADYPPERALILAQVVLIGLCILIGVVVVMVLNAVFQKRKINNNYSWSKGFYRLITLMMILCVLAAPIMLFRSVIGDWNLFQKWSRLWDERHEILLMAGKQDVEEIHVIQLDHVIDDVGDLAPDSEYWYNNCAEMYYDIEEIYADQPGW